MRALVVRFARFRRRALRAPLPQVQRGFSLAPRRFEPSAAGYWRAQWWAGLGRAGQIGVYAPSTAERKRRRGLPTDRVVLYDTGRMYAETALLAQQRQYVLKIKVPYMKYLLRRYGEHILSLHSTYNAEFVQDVRDGVIKSFRQWLSSG